MKEFPFTVRGFLQCGEGGSEMQSGDIARVYFDTVSYPMLPVFLDFRVSQPPATVTVMNEDGTCLVRGTRYQIEYDENLPELEEVQFPLEQCHILSVECVTCCVMLEERISLLSAEMHAEVERLETQIGEVEGASSANIERLNDEIARLDEKIDSAVAGLNLAITQSTAGFQEQLDALSENLSTESQIRQLADEDLAARIDCLESGTCDEDEG